VVKSIASLRSADARLEQSPTGSASTCFHCGLPVPAQTHWQVAIDQTLHSMCCPGCQAVAQSIIDHGFGDYYRHRSQFALTPDQDTLIPPELSLYDAPDFARRFEADDATVGEATFSIEGVRCAACAWLIEKRVARVPGAIRAELNVATEQLFVRWNLALCQPSHILQAVREIGYLAYPFDATRQAAQLERARKTLFRQLFIAGLSMMQAMMYAFPAYLATPDTLDAEIAALMRWAGLWLTLPVVGYSAQPFFKGAWNNLKNRMLGMDVPVALGIAAAFIGSVMATWRGEGDVYFDSITMFVFLLLCSRYLELSARRKAAWTLNKLQQALPTSAWRMPAYPQQRDTELVAAERLLEGDVILVKPGEAVAADGVILEGDTAVDLSLLTGESMAQRKTVGASLPSGAVNATQPLVLRVTRIARMSTLSVLMKLIERAGQGKPQLALWADRVAAGFVAALLLLATVVFMVWHGIDPARAWPIAMAVLVVSCPCALSLATPTALAVATDRLVRQGVLIVQPHVLETLHRATHIVFDKTGTLTVGQPVLNSIEALGVLSSAEYLQVAAALAASSTHPLSAAIVCAAQEGAPSARSNLSVDQVRHEIGRGLEGVVGGQRYRLGSADFVAELAGVSPTRAESDATAIYLGVDGAWCARFQVSDSLRCDARQVVRAFQASGKTVILLSGDAPAATQRIADELGIANALGGYLPEQKLAFVQNLQRQGATVAMVGDGINDAAVLRAANVSFAMGSGTAIAQMHADCVLLSGRLLVLYEAANMAARTFSIMRQNLAWALLYNAVAIPAAALGWLNPWLSAIGMSISSAGVVANALRLRLGARRTWPKER